MKISNERFYLRPLNNGAPLIIITNDNDKK